MSEGYHQNELSSTDAACQSSVKDKKQNSTKDHNVSKLTWYDYGQRYWQNTEPNYDGVTGGFSNLSQIDINFSRLFLHGLVNKIPTFTFGNVLDCGAGIGRVSKQLLSSLFKTIDVVDFCQKFVKKAKQILKSSPVRHYYCKGIQNFQFQDNYDCIWAQWVLLHLSDNDAVSFLRRARRNLKEGGVIIVKDNVSDDCLVIDKNDSSVIRPEEHYKRLFVQAGLTLVDEAIQPNWPEDMHDLRIYALV